MRFFVPVLLASLFGAGCVAPDRPVPVRRASPESMAAIRSVAAEMHQATHGIIFYPTAAPRPVTP